MTSMSPFLHEQSLFLLWITVIMKKGPDVGLTNCGSVLLLRYFPSSLLPLSFYFEFQREQDSEHPDTVTTTADQKALQTDHPTARSLAP